MTSQAIANVATGGTLRALPVELWSQIFEEVSLLRSGTLFQTIDLLFYTRYYNLASEVALAIAHLEHCPLTNHIRVCPSITTKYTFGVGARNHGHHTRCCSMDQIQATPHPIREGFMGCKNAPAIACSIRRRDRLELSTLNKTSMEHGEPKLVDEAAYRETPNFILWEDAPPGRSSMKELVFNNHYWNHYNYNNVWDFSRVEKLSLEYVHLYTFFSTVRTEDLTNLKSLGMRGNLEDTTTRINGMNHFDPILERMQHMLPRLQQLQELVVMYPHWTHFVPAGLICNLGPTLQKLCLTYVFDPDRNRMSRRDLRMIGQHCTRLEYLGLDWVTEDAKYQQFLHVLIQFLSVEKFVFFCWGKVNMEGAPENSTDPDYDAAWLIMEFLAKYKCGRAVKSVTVYCEKPKPPGDLSNFRARTPDIDHPDFAFGRKFSGRVIGGVLCCTGDERLGGSLEGVPGDVFENGMEVDTEGTGADGPGDEMNLD
ncbi:hypothetical protein BDZ45DRAFT_743978 [Acephala macrosclerotiorum]|nr:hypothetical protein BDZ45DRAFT_743978 [Acephala macrosclerotiorum]